MKADHHNESAAEFSVSEYKRVKAAAVARGLNIEGFKRQCVRRIMWPTYQPSPPAKAATGLRALVQRLGEKLSRTGHAQPTAAKGDSQRVK